jgi:hydrogenase 3 maturation protease
MNAASAELTRALRERLRGRVAIMGVGNPLRGDDGVGSVVARKLRRAFAWVPAGEPADEGAVATVAVVDAEEIPESFLGVLEAARPAVVVLVDAAELGCEAGSLVLLEGARLQGQATCTHRTPLAPVARYLEQRTGAAVILAGIQPGCQRWGDALSSEVSDTANRLANILWDALRPMPGEAPDGARTLEASVC